jgi:ABC-type transporter Mla subunit MlaD
VLRNFPIPHLSVPKARWKKELVSVAQTTETPSAKGSTSIPQYPSNYYLAQQLEKIMSGLTDLQAAVAALTTAVASVAAALTAAAGDSDATVESLAQAVNTQVSALNAAVAAATPPATQTTSS